MYPTIFRSRSVRYVALAAVAVATFLPAFLPGVARAVVQQPHEDELVPFAEPVPFLPFYHSGEFEDGDVFYTPDAFGGSGTVESLEAEAKRLDEMIKEAKESVDAARKSDDKAKQRTAESRVMSLERSRAALQKVVERAKRFAPLQKKVDVKFENATVAQAAEALSRASGVQIKVDDTIPDTTRLTVEARKVRLVTVIESLARQAGLTIDPINIDKGEVGIELIAPPMLRVNNTVQQFATAPSPWTEKWGTPPTSRYLYSSGLPRVWNYATANGNTITRTYVDGISAEAMGRSAEAIGRSMAALGDLAAAQGLRAPVAPGKGGTTVFTVEKGTSIIVSKPGTVTVVEAAKNDKNGDGHWRTSYTLKNGELVQQSRVWEKAK